jgi:hypothetical protein
MALTTVHDTIYDSQGKQVTGLSISAIPNVKNTWQSGDGKQLYAVKAIANINTDGSFDIQLIPNDTAVPSGTAYNVTLQVGTAPAWTETWVVPTSSTPVNLTTVRILSPPPPPSQLIPISQLAQGTAAAGQGIVWDNTAGLWVPGALGTAGFTDVKIVIPFTDAVFIAASPSVNRALFTLPANAKVTNDTIKHSVAFAGVTSPLVSVGDGGSNLTAYAEAFDIGQAIAVTAFSDTAEFLSVTAAAHVVYATFTAAGNFGNGTITNLTAGFVTIWITWKQLS